MVMFATTAHATAISFVVNVHLLLSQIRQCFRSNVFSLRCFLLFSSCGPDGFQLRALRPAVGQPDSRSWKNRGFTYSLAALSIVHFRITNLTNRDYAHNSSPLISQTAVIKTVVFT